MKSEHAFISEEESILSTINPGEIPWKVNAELSNIISLAEQGLLRTPQPEDKVEETYFYNSYSPLNEW